VIPTLLEVALALAATPAEALAGGSPAASGSCVVPAPAAPAPTQAVGRATKAPDERRATAGHDAEAAAVAMVKEARDQYEAGRKEEATALLRKAHALYPTPRIALALARSESELKRPARAVAVLNDMLRDATLTPAEREEARKLVDELRAGLGGVSIGGLVDVAYQLDDGREVFGGEMVWVEPGPHVVIGPGGQRIAFTATIGAQIAIALEVPGIEGPLAGVPTPPPSPGCACRKEPSYAGGGHFPESVAVAAMGLVIARRRRRR
jgi:hypothetical protein